MVDTDCPSDLDDEEEMRIQKEMAQELSNQSTDNRVHETFDDSDFDAEDLGVKLQFLKKTFLVLSIFVTILKLKMKFNTCLKIYCICSQFYFV